MRRALRAALSRKRCKMTKAEQKKMLALAEQGRLAFIDYSQRGRDWSDCVRRALDEIRFNAGLGQLDVYGIYVLTQIIGATFKLMSLPFPSPSDAHDENNVKDWLLIAHLACSPIPPR